MKARFSTTCIVCDGYIQKGKEIVKNEAGNWVHKHLSLINIQLDYHTIGENQSTRDIAVDV